MAKMLHWWQSIRRVNQTLPEPVYLHQDQRIASMLLLNILALLAYTLLERQLRQQGLPLTTRKLLKRLEQLTLINQAVPPVPQALLFYLPSLDGKH